MPSRDRLHSPRLAAALSACRPAGCEVVLALVVTAEGGLHHDPAHDHATLQLAADPLDGRRLDERPDDRALREVVAASIGHHLVQLAAQSRRLLAATPAGAHAHVRLGADGTLEVYAASA